jgi:hypothetical protein
MERAAFFCQQCAGMDARMSDRLKGGGADRS